MSSSSRSFPPTPPTPPTYANVRLTPATAPAATHVRLAGPADAPGLASRLQRARPLPVAAQRARAAALEDLVAKPERGACLVAERSAEVVGVLPVVLFPSLGQAGLVAFASEWWPLEASDGGLPLVHQDGAVLASCLEALADWCRVHGVRRLLLAPGLHGCLQPAVPAVAARYRLGHDGLWCRELEPAAKQLG